MTEHLYQKYYHAQPGFRGGTLPFFDLCTANIPKGADILEIGAGAENSTTKLLSALGKVTAIDVDPDVRNNSYATKSKVFDGVHFPIPDGSIDACVSNWVLEHVADPVPHFCEVARVMRPGGVYCFRTPNLFHYVTLGSRLLPHSVHLLLANRLRKMAPEAHPPWPTFYRANRPGLLKQLTELAGLSPASLTMIEPEPAYGRAHAGLFYPMMAYERIVNSTRFFETFRIIIIGSSRKPSF
jgi:SAM-dependent methyltransferase